MPSIDDAVFIALWQPGLEAEAIGQRMGIPHTLQIDVRSRSEDLS
jgi:hypothetical protein